MLHSSSNAPGSGVQCVSLAENGIFFIMKKGSRQWLYPPNLSYLTMCSTWGSQSSKRVQGSQQQTDGWCSWVLLMGKVMSVGWCLLGQSSVGSWDKIKPSMEAKKSCSSLWKCRDLLVLAWAGRNKSPYAELEPNPFWPSTSWGQGCWDIISAPREDKSLEAYLGLAEIPGEKAESRENMVCYWHEGSNWMASGGHGQDLCGRRNPLFHPYSMGWNRQGIIYMHIPECLRV